MSKLKTGKIAELFLLFILALILLFMTLEKYILPNFGTCVIYEKSETCTLGFLFTTQEITND